ncbi:GDP/GTP exchange factor for ARF [Entophlyctis sp. JEL0112]|nr:GDP/GTP exchange factor for ARF [Entophlyctis sp. JEL0112]
MVSTLTPSLVGTGDSADVPVELSGLHLVHAEISAVTAAMRKNARWSLANLGEHSSQTYSSYNARSTGSNAAPDNDLFSDPVTHSPNSQLRGLDSVLEFTKGQRLPVLEGPLLAGFSRLKARISLLDDVSNLEPMHLLTPFLDVIKSGDTTGPITGTALSSVEKFIKYKVIVDSIVEDPNHPSLPHAMSVLTHTVSNCKFEATDAASDEVVLTKILRLIRVTVSSEAGRRTLDDKAICEMVETAFGMCFQGRVSEILRRTSEHTLVVLTEALFVRVSEILKASDFQTRSSGTKVADAVGTNDKPSENYGNPPIGSKTNGVSEEGVETDGPLISISDKSTGLQGSQEPEVIVVGSGQDENNSVLGIKLDGDSFVAEGSEEELNQSSPLTPADDIKKDERKIQSETGSVETPAAIITSPRIFLPFGLPAALELMRVLVTLMDPRNRNHTDTSHRVIALTLLNVVVEVGGRSLGKWIGWGLDVEAKRTEHGGLISDEEKMALAAKELVVSELLKYLFQLLQNMSITYNSPPSSNNMTVLSLTLRLLTTLFQTSRYYLKYQLEYFLDWMMAKVDTGVVSWDVNDPIEGSAVDDSGFNPRERPSSAASITSSRMSIVTIQQNVAGRNVLVPEAREMILETILQCCRMPGFFTELWVNFDGDSNCQGNLYEELVRFFSKIMERKAVTQDTSLFSEPSPEELLGVKLRKRLLAEGAERFNKSPKEGIRFLQEQKLLPTPADPQSIANFLKTTPGVNKKLIGEYIAKRGNEDILKTFIKLYNFKGKRLDEGLRLLLESFRLPGEAQLIERVVENFAEGYYQAMEDTHDHHIADQSSAFVLAFSIILLNTDQHNPQVRRRMTPEDFQKNNRGCNNGKDFDAEYLKAIYDAIKHNEIVMPEEHEGDLGFNYTWRELMKRSETASPLMISPKGVFSKDMFAAVCDPTVAAISYAFDSAEDSLTLQKAVVGYQRCAAIANLYRMTDVLDNIIISLSKTTGLLKDHRKFPLESKVNESTGLPGKVTVDQWSVEFGRNYKSQVAAVLMFNLASEYGNSLRNGWKNVVSILGNLFLHSLLPKSILNSDNFIRRNVPIPRLKSAEVSSPPKKESSQGSGLFFSLTQLLSLGSTDEEEQPPTAEELEAEKLATACIASCRIEELFLDTRFLEEASLKHFASVLVEACETMPKLAKQSSQTAIFSGAEENFSEKSKLLTVESSAQIERKTGKYSVAAAFYLEMIVNVTFHNRDRLKVVWPAVFELISGILGSEPEHPTLMERSVVGLLRLLIRMVHKEDMFPQVVESLDILSSMSEQALTHVAEQLLAGFLQLIKTDPNLIIRYSKWNSVKRLLNTSSLHPEASRFGLEVVFILVNEGPSSPVNADNFGDCVELLLGFANSAGVFFLNSANVASSPEIPRSAGVTTKPAPKITPAVQAACERGMRALDKVFSLTARIPGLISNASIGRERGWFEFWLPLLSGLAHQCYNPVKELRQHSLTLLQRTLLSPEVESTVFTPKRNSSGSFDGLTSSTLETGVDCFENVLFPLLEELLKPEIRRLDANGMDETRVRVVALLCKIFLQYLGRLVRYKDLSALWIRVLDYIHRYVTAGGSEFVTEGVLESLKNILLVMSTQKVFQPKVDKDQDGPVVSQNLWEITWEQVNKFYPGLQDELFPSLPQTKE